MNENKVKNFYDEFSKNNLLSDFLNFNVRQNEVIHLCKKFIYKGSTILEIGCGTGIITKSIVKLAQKVISIDISENNIHIAKQYVKSSKVDFLRFDILNEEINKLDKFKFDAILLADVIEHIPKNKHKQLFNSLNRLLKTGGRILLTYPTPYFQRFNRKVNPNLMQIIDEEIDLVEILSNSSLEPIHFLVKDVWKKNQYIHLVLQKDVDYLNQQIKRPLSYHINYRARKYFWKIRNFPFFYRIRNEFKK